MMTHWLLPFTSRNRRGEQMAACGEYINPKQHSSEPTCETCAAYLVHERQLDADLEATFAEDPRR